MIQNRYDLPAQARLPATGLASRSMLDPFAPPTVAQLVNAQAVQLPAVPSVLQPLYAAVSADEPQTRPPIQPPGAPPVTSDPLLNAIINAPDALRNFMFDLVSGEVDTPNPGVVGGSAFEELLKKHAAGFLVRPFKVANWSVGQTGDSTGRSEPSDRYLAPEQRALIEKQLRTISHANLVRHITASVFRHDSDPWNLEVRDALFRELLRRRNSGPFRAGTQQTTDRIQKLLKAVDILRRRGWIGPLMGVTLGAGDFADP